MRFYLRSQGLWQAILSEDEPPPLRVNPTIAQIKAHEEEKLKKDKTITYIHSGLADHIFTKIMDLESPKQVWDKLKEEYEGSDRVKSVKLLTLKRELELMKMNGEETIKDYSNRLMDLVNQMRLLGRVVKDQQVVEKIMVNVPQKFEGKISAIEESCDIQTLTTAELISKLQVQEQRTAIRSDEAMQAAFLANQKEKKPSVQKDKKQHGKGVGKERSFESAKGNARRGKFPPCSHCKKQKS